MQFAWVRRGATVPPASERELRGVEHFDRALHVVTPRAWLALLTLAALVSAAIGWAWLGRIATYVPAHGIVFGRGGTVHQVASRSAGTLVGVLPSLGDAVTAGEVVAEIHHAETAEQHATALALVDELTRALGAFRAEARESDALSERNLARRRANLQALEQSARDLMENASKRHRGDLALFEDGLLAEFQADLSERNVDFARRNLFDVMRRRDDLEAGELSRQARLRTQLTDAEINLVAAEREVEELETVMEDWRLRAPISGRVTEVKAQAGAVLQTGQSVLGIGGGDDGLDVLLYVPPAEGKRVEPGMRVLISPATVRSAEYGYITGAVASLSEFPASVDSMTAVLQNRELAEAFSIDGAPYAGRIALTPDPATASGLAWTSSKGAEVNVTAGTLAEIEIEVESQPPISLVVPMLKEWLGY